MIDTNTAVRKSIRKINFELRYLDTNLYRLFIGVVYTPPPVH